MTLTGKVSVGLVLGVIVGIIIHVVPLPPVLHDVIVVDVLQLGGDIFLRLLRLLVVPVVFVSLVCGVAALTDPRKLTRIGLKTIALYFLTTAIAVALALCVASLFSVGGGLQLHTTATVNLSAIPSVQSIILNIFPSNPFAALVEGRMLQVIFLALFFGCVLNVTKEAGQRVLAGFESLNVVILKAILCVMAVAPYGVFFLLAHLFARVGVQAIWHLFHYFVTVLFVLALQLCVSYAIILTWARLKWTTFIRKIIQPMLFAFSVSSSNASIPVVLKNVRERLGVSDMVSSFVIPLGATINMDGTAIMQGVATVFIAHVYHLSLGLGGFLTVIVMATLASIGTAGVPGVGLITLAMVLRQVGLPVEGVALIIGVDRLLDMARTAVNIAGDSMVACVVGRSESQLDLTTFNSSTKVT